MKTLPLPEIIARIVAINGCDESVAQMFLKEFASVVENTLADDGTLDIKGLGTFRRIELGGEVTVEFAPERELSAAVNMPFAMFEPVELDDDMTAEMLDDASAVPAVPASPETTETTETAVESEEAVHTEEIIHAEETSEETSVEATVETTVETTEEAAVETTEEAAVETTEEPHDEPAEPLPHNIPPVPEEELVRSMPRRANEAPVQQKPMRNEPAPVVTHEKIIETERVVKVHDSSHSRLTIILASALSLIAGLLIGYFAYDKLNITNVKSVNISADDVQVFHQVKALPAAEPESRQDTAGITETVAAEATPTPAVAPVAKTDGTDAKAVVTDTIKSNRFLTTMALQHYGKKKFWVYIYEENRSKIDDPDHIAPNTVVVIPPAAKYGIKSGDQASEADAEKRAAEIMKNKKRAKS